MRLSCIPICLFADLRSGKLKIETWYEMAARLRLEGIEMYDAYLTHWDEKSLSAAARRVSDRNAKLTHVVVGQDLVEFDAIFHILKCEANDDGWISAEAGGRPTESNVRASLDFLRKTREEA